MKYKRLILLILFLYPVPGESASDYYTNWNDITCMAISGQVLWAGTVGGLVEWNTVTGEYKVYSFLDNVPGSRIQAINTGKDGIVYATTSEGGIFRISKQIVEQLEGNNYLATPANCLSMNNVNRLYLGDDKGNVSYMENDFFVPVPFMDSGEKYKIFDIGFDNNSIMWVGTSKGVAKLEDSSWNLFNLRAREHDHVYDVEYIPGLGTCFGTSNGIWIHDRGEWKIFNHSNGLPGTEVKFIKGDPKNNFWCLVNGVLCFYDGRKFTIMSLPISVKGKQVKDIEVDDAGILWCGTTRGIYSFDGRSWKPWLVTRNFINIPVYSMIKIEMGGFLAACKGGLFRFTGKTWNIVSINDKEVRNTFTCLSSGKNGVVWAGTKNDGIYIIGKNKWYPLDMKGVKGKFIQAIYPLTEQYFWFSAPGGVFRYKDGAIRGYTTADGLLGDNVLDILVTAEETWLAGEGGVTRINGESITGFEPQDNSWGNKCLVIKQDNAGVTWFAWDKGISKYVNEKMVFYHLPASDNRVSISSLFISPENQVWVGLKKGGLRIFDGNTFINPGVLTGAEYLTITSGVFDSQGNLWLGTQHGILSYRVDSENRTGSAATIGQTMVSLDPRQFKWESITNGNDVYSLGIKNETLWAGTSGGVIQWDLTIKKYVKHLAGKELVGNHITDVYIDREGGTWVVSDRDGVSLYKNGKWGSMIPGKNLPFSGILQVVEEKDGAKWFATRGMGVLRYDGARWEKHGIEQGVAAEEISCIMVDSRGSLWVGTDNGLSNYHGGKWITYTVDNGLVNNHVRALCQAYDGAIWIGTWKGISRFDGVNWTSYTIEDNLPDDRVLCLHVDVANRVWAGTAQGGISWFENNKWYSFGEKDGFISNQVRDIVSDPKGRIYFATDKGIGVLASGTWSRMVTADKLPSNNVLSLCEDKDGTLWVGSGTGLIKWVNESFITVISGTDSSISKKHGKETRALLVDSLGNLWEGTAGFGINVLSGNSWFHYKAGKDLLNNQVTSFYEDQQGGVWIGSFGGLNLFNRDKWFRYTKNKGLPSNYVWGMTKDNRDNLWVATMQGVAKFDGKSWITYTVADGLASNGVFSVCQDKMGNLWFATFEGASRFNGMSWHTYTKKDGLAGNRVRKILVDPTGILWFATEDGGLSRFDGKKFINFNVKNGVASNDVRDMLVTSKGKLVLATGSGICSTRILGTRKHFPVAKIPSPTNDSSQLETGIHLGINTFSGIVNVFPKQPSIGNKLVIQYEPHISSQSMVNSKRMWLVLDDGYSRYEMVKQDKSWVAKFVPPADRSLLVFYFVNNKDQADNNNGNNWFVPLFTPAGKPIKNSYFHMAKRIFLAQNPDREQGYKLLQEEFTYYPKNWKARLFKWFVGLRFGDYTPGKIRDEAYQLNAMYPDSCEIDYLCAEIFGRLNDKETRIYFLEKIVDQYKNCDLADEALFDLAELFPGKTLDYLENLLDKYPRSNRAMDARQRIAYITEYRDPDPKKYISNALAWINMQPANPDPCFELAKYLLDHPDPRHDTLKYARKGLQLCLPGETPAKYLVILGKAYANQGNYKESEYYLMQALKINVSKKILYELIPVCKKNNSLDQLVPYIFKIHLEDIRDKDVFELLVSTLDEQLLQNKSFDMFYRVMMEKNSISVEDVYLAQVGADPVSFHQLAGRKTSIVYLWQPWNILSRHGLSYLSRLLQKNPGLNIYAIALNTEKETVTKFKHVIDPRVQVLFLKESSFGKWNTSSLPVILVANGNGKIIFVHNNIEEDTVGLLLEEVFMLDELGNNVPVSNVLGTK